MIKTFQDGKKWRSVRQAAKSLEVEAKKAATEEGARFTTDDVPSRLYEWFLKARKNGMSGGQT